MPLNMFKLGLYFFCFYFSSLPIFGQRNNFLSRTEIGLMAGGMYYIGDLNPIQQFKNTQASVGFLFRHSVHSRFSLRANALYGSVKADDSESNIDLFKNRNLNFSSTILELAAGVEFNYMPFEVGHNKYKGTAYLMAGAGMFRMNPMSEYNDNLTALQPLGTEGQSSSLNSSSPYSLTQLNIPFGLGVRATISKRISFNVEFGVRRTFTDYLDDVKSDNFVDPVLLADANGPIAASLSNKNLDGSIMGYRGDSSTKDWYVFTGLMLMIKLGDPSNCFYH
jgi:hypothetical protein